jgi:hypothetical protein
VGGVVVAGGQGRTAGQQPAADRPSPSRRPSTTADAPRSLSSPACSRPLPLPTWDRHSSRPNPTSDQRLPALVCGTADPTTSSRPRGVGRSTESPLRSIRGRTAAPESEPPVQSQRAGSTSLCSRRRPALNPSGTPPPRPGDLQRGTHVCVASPSRQPPASSLTRPRRPVSRSTSPRSTLAARLGEVLTLQTWTRPTQGLTTSDLTWSGSRPPPAIRATCSTEQASRPLPRPRGPEP